MAEGDNEIDKLRARSHEQTSDIAALRMEVGSLARRLDGHEDLCTERWRALQQQRVEDRQAHENWKVETRERSSRILDRLDTGEKLHQGKHDENLGRFTAIERKINNSMLRVVVTALSISLSAIGVMAWYILTHGGAK